MLDSPLSVSLPPEELSVARRVPGGVELKFSWRHRDLLVGERDLDALLDDAGVDAERIATVHLPPGTETRGGNVGMALTRANRGAIATFVHSQLSCLPAADLVAHPPKRAGYGESIPVLASLLDITDRTIAVENTSAESAWYAPEDLGFVAVLAERYEPLSDLRLTVDSAHLPRDGRPGVTPERVDAIRERLGPDVPAVALDFERELRDRLPDEWDPSVVESPYFPLLASVHLAGQAVRSVHLNDPRDDGVPRLDPHADDPALDRALAALADRGADVVVEPDAGLREQPEELRARVTALRDRMAAVR
ncbi:hypothetical protein NGM10_05695 [Halorussus salilacus]|uniref:hypothetical protein n=1 Tax=Halorussus salilacus TaxID=2953750 RepID=UPI00209C9040|nr:hypothetical protein [Halorussus salilacus]USZ69233.1 hypothetical protein NGM10_05695 [Halorussus salilacus]